MPSKSASQHRLMQAVSHSPSFAKKVGIPQSVGSEFERADKGRKFAKGGEAMATKLASLFKGKESYSEELKEGKAIKSGKITPEQYAKGEKMESMKKSSKMTKGGKVVPPTDDKDDGKGTARKFAKGGSIDGVAQRGKTQGKVIKMAMGGGCK